MPTFNERPRWPRRHARRGDRGAVLVEAAIVTPLLMLLVFGLLEMGLLFRAYLGVTAATRDGARTASIASNDPGSDWHILQSIKRTGAALPDGSVQRIVVFSATGTDDEPSAACKAGAPAATELCNVYTPADWDTFDPAKIECDGPPDPNWCGKDRSSSNASPSYIGVWVTVQHDYVTGMIGDFIDIDETVVYRIEPTER